MQRAACPPRAAPCRAAAAPRARPATAAAAPASAPPRAASASSSRLAAPALPHARRRRASHNGTCLVRAASGGGGNGNGKGSSPPSPFDDVMSKLRAAAPLVEGAASFVPVRCA
jgi:hypothetical protein